MLFRIVVVNESGSKEFRPWHNASITSLIAIGFIASLYKNCNYYIEYKEREV